MGKVLKINTVINLKLGNESGQFLIQQYDVKVNEIKDFYKEYCLENAKKPTLDELIYELEQYGLELLRIDSELVTIEL